MKLFVEAVDKNGDGQIDLEELLSLMRKLGAEGSDEELLLLRENRTIPPIRSPSNGTRTMIPLGVVHLYLGFRFEPEQPTQGGLPRPSTT